MTWLASWSPAFKKCSSVYMGLLDQIRNARSPRPATEDSKLVQSGIIQNDDFHEYVLTSTTTTTIMFSPLKNLST